MMRHSWMLLAVMLASTTAAAAAAAPSSAASAAGEQPTTCSIHITGTGPDEEGIQSANVACSGSGVGMAISSAKLGKFKQQFKGLVSPPEGCGKDIDCLLTFCGSSHIIIADSSISNVVDAASTGMLCVTSNSSVTIRDSTLHGNVAGNGTIHVRDQAQVTVINSVITNATGVRGGGAQLSGKSVLKSINSTWANNTAEYGAGVNVRGDSALWILNGSVFDSNYAYTEYDYGPAGAAAYCRDSGRIYVQNNNVFQSNVAEGYDSAGGAIYLQDDCMVDIKDGNIFNSNAAVLDNAAGGALLGADRSLVTVTGHNTFYNNSALGDNSGGGAILVRDEAMLKITNGVNFTQNHADGDVAQGGAVYASNDVNLLIENDVTFDDNTAFGVNSQGGAVNIRQGAATTIRRGVQFSGNAASYGGGLAAIGDMLLNMSDAVFVDHEVLGHGGAVYLEGSFTAIMDSCLVQNNRAAQGGGVMATTSTSSRDSNFTLSLTGHTRILNNSATTGGGVSLVSGVSTVGPGVVIADNYAAQGGGISISQGPAASASVTFSPDALVTNNTAVVAGGGIYLDAASVHINEATARAIATGNTAAFGADMSLLTECLPGEVRAGAWCQTCGANLFSFNPANKSCDICPDDATCTGGTVIIPRSGYWHSSAWSTQIHRCPNPEACSQPGRERLFGAAAGVSSSGSSRQSAAATAAAGALAAATPATSGGASNSRSLRSYLVGAAGAGGAPRFAGDSRPEFRSHSRSMPGLQDSDIERQTAAADRRLLHPRLAWRPGRALMAPAAAAADPTYAAAAAPTLPMLPTDTVDWQCAPGYRGHLCGSCEADHGVRGPFKCARCLSVKLAAALYAVAFVVLMALIWIVAHVTWLDNQVANPELRLSDVFKVLIVYFQCMMIMTSLPVDWPACIEAVFAAMTWLFSAGNSQLLSVDCLVAHMSLSLPVAIIRQLVHLLVPLVMFAAVVLLQCCVGAGQLLWRRYHRRRLAHGFLSGVRVRIPVIAIVTFMFFYPSLMRVALSMFACYPIDTDSGLYPQYAVANASSGYWQYDMDEVCWAGWHKDWALGLGLPFTLLFCIAVPVGIALLMYLNRERHDDPGFRRHFGLLYRLYCQRCSFWEAVVAVQFVLLVVVSVFGPNLGAWHEALLLNCLFGIFTVLLLLVRPYRFERLHTIALLSMGCLTLTAYAALSFLPSMRGDVGHIYKEVAGAVVLVLNIGFLLWVAYCLAMQIKQLISKIRSAKAAGSTSSKGPKESKLGYPAEPQLGNRRAASTAGVKAGAAAATTLALAAAKAANTPESRTARSPAAPTLDPV